MSLLAYVVGLALPLVALGLWSGARRARLRLSPGPAGFWRGGWIVPSYGLLADERVARLRALPSAAVPFLGVSMLLVAWGALGPHLLAPLFAEAALPEPLASFVRQPISLSAFEWAIVVFWVLGGLVDLASGFEQTDVFVERDGDLRVTTRTWLGVREVVSSTAEFVGFSLDDSRKAVLTLGGPDSPRRSVELFRAPRRPLMDPDHVRADLARAEAAFRAAIGLEGGR